MLEKMEKLMDNIEEQQNTTEEVTSSNDNIKQLREEFKKIKAENKQLKGQAMSSALSELGLNADVGLGKAVTKLYDGDVTTASIKEFVESEFGEVNAINADTQPAPASNNVVDAQSRVEQLNKLGVNAEPQNVIDEFAKFVNNPETSVKDSLRAKFAMLENEKDN